MMKKLTLVCLGISALSQVFSNEDSTLVLEDSLLMQIVQYQEFQDSVENAMNYQYGEIQIQGGVATLSVPEGFKFLGPEQSSYVLSDLWGNPPAQSAGILFPDSASPFDAGGYVIEMTYSEEGYIEDDDAEDLDYEDLLEEMKEDTKAASIERDKAGFGTIQLIGWAASPFYDSDNKKLHWAKEYKFNDAETNSLNYNIRVLGRKGYLNMNAIGEIDVLPLVNNDIDKVLASVQFNEGYKYSEFDPDLDEVAAYGIGGLIAGKLLAKAGIFVLLAKFWKFIAIGVVGIGAFLKNKVFGKKEEN